MAELDGKVAVVYGAGCIGDGIGNGRAAAIALARGGSVVHCADLDVDRAEATRDMITAEGGEAYAHQCDVTSFASVKHVADTVFERHGRLDIADNNVGVASVGGVTEVALDEWRRVLDINLSGVFHCMRAVIPHIIAGGGGSIVNISSVAGISWTGVPYAAYYASKAGVINMTKTSAVEFADRGVRINTILPGLMKTPMVESISGIKGAYHSASADDMWAARSRQVPMGHMGSAWDVADAVVFLSSDRAKYITGAELVIDGGFTLSVKL